MRRRAKIALETSMRVLHKGETIKRRTIKRRANLEVITMGDVHDEIEFVRSHKGCPNFVYIELACEGLELVASEGRGKSARLGSSLFGPT